MKTQPIDPRALKAAEALYPNGNPNSEFWSKQLVKDFQESKARIIQSHFAESVNGKLLEAAKEVSDSICRAANSREIDPECYLSGLNKILIGEIALAQSKPTSMADELAEALRALLLELTERTHESHQWREVSFVGGQVCHVSTFLNAKSMLDNHDDKK